MFFQPWEPASNGRDGGISKRIFPLLIPVLAPENLLYSFHLLYEKKKKSRKIVQMSSGPADEAI